jgi:hypothetical protein
MRHLRKCLRTIKYSGNRKLLIIKIMKMKMHIIFSVLIAAVLMTGCKKKDGMLPDYVVTDVVPQVRLAINGGSAAIDLTNLASFQGKFDVSLLYPNDIKPVKLDVVVMKNGNTGNIKVFQAGLTTYPTSLTVTAAQIVALFGTPIVLGDTYDFGLDIYTQSGKKYEAFPVVGAAYGSTGVANQPNFSVTARYAAICAYSGTLFGPIGGTANFQVLTDEWGDDPVNGWGPPAGYRPTVLVTIVDATHLSFKSPVNGTSVIVLTINPLNNNITYTGQPYGDLAVGPLQVDPTYTYGPATLSNLGPNTVAPCDLKLNLAIAYNVAAGQFRWNASRGYFLVLKKI